MIYLFVPPVQVHHNDSFVVSEPCKCCHATGRVEALETSFSKIEREILRFLVSNNSQFSAVSFCKLHPHVFI